MNSDADTETSTLTERHAPLSVRSFGLTDTGRVRTVNQDQFLVAVLLKALQVEQTSIPQRRVQHSSDRSHLFVVADGMGGHAAGEQASTMAIDSVETFILDTFKWFAEFKEPEHDQVLTDFQMALGEANARVLAESRDWTELRGMGTTLTLAYILNDVLFIAHVGGASASLRVEVHKLQLETDDRLLLCSDGLTGMLTDDEITRVLLDTDEPSNACRQLVSKANDAGGKDNITVVVADFRVSGTAGLQEPEKSSTVLCQRQDVAVVEPDSVVEAAAESP